MKHITLNMATEDRLLRAYNKAAKSVHGDPEGLQSSSVTAGYIIPAGQKKGQRTGWQVSVKLERFSEAELISNPLSGGLS